MKTNDINHVAIIMDGNGRWAEQHNLPRFSGHKKGLDVIPEVVEELINNLSLIHISEPTRLY